MSPPSAPRIAGYYAMLDVRAGLTGELLPATIEAEVARAERLLGARPCCLQLRGKQVGDRSLLVLARRLVPLCRAAGVAFCINDRVDLAFLAGADLVHVGQDDLPIAEVRGVQQALGRRLPIGVSTHNLAQAEAAVRAGADYIGFGPVFATGSKANPDPVVGLAGLREICATVAVPVVAIGGISRATIGAVIEAGAAAAAVIGDIDAAEDPGAAAAEIARAFVAVAAG